MFFNNNWISQYHAQLREYAQNGNFGPKRIRLLPNLIWLLVIQCSAAYIAISSETENAGWVFCILILLSNAIVATTATILTVVFCCDKKNGSAGYFRYNSVYLFLLSVSFLLLAIAISIHKLVTYPLVYSIAVGFVISAFRLWWIRKKIERSTLSKRVKKEAKASAHIVTALSYWIGFGFYWICKSGFSDKYLPVLLVFFITFLSASLFCGSVECWLKSVGVNQFNGAGSLIDGNSK